MIRRERHSVPILWISVAAILVLGLTATPAAAVSIHAGLAVTDFGSPSVFGFSFGVPYADGPYNYAAANVGGTLGDFSGNGASLNGSLVGRVDAVPFITIPLNVSIASGDAGTLETVPSGAGPAGSASSAVSTGTGGTISQTVSYTMSGGGDVTSLTVLGVLTGGASPEVIMNSIAVIDFGGSSTFNFTFNTPFTGQHDTLRVGLLGALMDGTDDGASITNLHLETFIDSIEVAGVDLTGNYTTSPGQLAISAFPSGSAFSAAQVTSFSAPGSGMLFLDLNFNLSGGGDQASLVAGVELFNAQPIPEPATLSLLGMAIVGVAVRRRRKRGGGGVGQCVEGRSQLRYAHRVF